MKKALFTRVFGLAFGMSCLGFGAVQAQNCEAYFPMKTGATFELTHYDGKDKVTSVTKTTMSEKESTATSIVATAHATTFDPKGKELSNVEYDVTCSNGEFHMDMKSMGSPMSQVKGLESLEIKMESSDMVFPSNLTVGQSLPDASMHMTGSMNGMKIIDNNTTVTNRKVVAKESITTPAGTFSCVVIEGDSKTSSTAMNFEVHTKSWFALNTGMVKTESTRNGQPSGSSILTKFSGN